jgi:S1-C subfamily serine protease
MAWHWDKRRQTNVFLVLIILASAVTGGVVAELIRNRHGQGELPRMQLANPETAENQEIVDVVKKVGPAVVLINTRRDEVVYDWFLRPMMRQAEGLGSGVIFDKRGYILTNNHVVADAAEIRVTLPDKRTFTGKKIGGDELTDVAVIKISGRSLPVAALADSDKVRVGETVVAIGNPYGFDNTVTVGVISALERSLSEPEENVYLENLIQTDASINPGNSGGPLLNLKGEVVGINTAIIQQAQGIGFSIPTNSARKAAEELVKYGKVVRLGILGTPLTKEVAAALSRQLKQKIAVNQGVFVTQVVEKSPAAQAGLKAGDIVVAIDGRKITKMEELQQSVRKAGYGGSVRLTVNRQGREIKIKVVIR